MRIPKKRNTPQLWRQRLRQLFAVFQYSGRAVELVWTTSRALTSVLAVLTLSTLR